MLPPTFNALLITLEEVVYLMVPVGDGQGLAKPVRGGGMLICKGCIGLAYFGAGEMGFGGGGGRGGGAGSSSLINDSNFILMLVLGNLKVHLK